MLLRGVGGWLYLSEEKERLDTVTAMPRVCYWSVPSAGVVR